MQFTFSASEQHHPHHAILDFAWVRPAKPATEVVLSARTNMFPVEQLGHVRFSERWPFQASLPLSSEVNAKIVRKQVFILARAFHEAARMASIQLQTRACSWAGARFARLQRSTFCGRLRPPNKTSSASCSLLRSRQLCERKLRRY